MRIKALFVFLFASASLWAQESLISDRPGQTYSSQVLNQWRVQYQQGFEWRDFYTRPLDGTILVEQRRLTADAAFRLGLGQNLEAGLAYSYTGINNPFSMMNTAVKVLTQEWYCGLACQAPPKGLAGLLSYKVLSPI